MSQTVFFHYRTPIESIRYNKFNSLLYESCVISGFHLIPSTTHEFGVDITRGTDAVSGAIFQNGATVMETDLAIESLALDAAHTSYYRMDAIVIEYVHGYGTTSVTFKVVKGSEHPTEYLKPVTNQYQVPLGYIKIRPNSVSIQKEDITETIRGLTLRNQSGKSNLVKLSGKTKGYISGLDIGNYRQGYTSTPPPEGDPEAPGDGLLPVGDPEAPGGGLPPEGDPTPPEGDDSSKMYATIYPGSLAIDGVMAEIKNPIEIVLFDTPIGETSIWVVAEFINSVNAPAPLPTIKAITAGQFNNDRHLLLYKFNLPTWGSLPSKNDWIDYIASPSKFLDFRHANALFGGQGLLTTEYLGITNGDFLVPDGYDVTVNKNPAGGWDYTTGVGRCYIGMTEFVHDTKVITATDHEGKDRWDLIYVNKETTYVSVLEKCELGLFDKIRHLPIAWVRIPADALSGEEVEIIYSSFTPKTIVDTQEEMYAILQWLSILEVQTLNITLQNDKLQVQCDALETRIKDLETKVNA